MRHKCGFCEQEIQSEHSGEACTSNWVITKDELILACGECYKPYRKGIEMAVKANEENKKEVGIMTLLIACLLIWGFNFPWWMYLVTMGIWVTTRMIKGIL